MSRNISEDMKAFATAIWAKKAAHDSTENAVHKRRLLESISDDIKKASTFHRHSVSVAAKEKARRMRAQPKLSELTWHDQRRFDPEREMFVTDHMIPVSAIRQRCLRATSEQRVKSILARDIKVVWILREEDKELNKNGHRFRRPDPGAAYRHAGIKISH